MNSLFARLAVILITLAAATALADDWPSPQVQEVFSASRSYFVRVTPGTSVGDLRGFAGAAKGAYAAAEFFRRERDGSYRPVARATLLNPVAPVQIFVADDGTLATLDNWHNKGYGTAVAIYGTDGKLVKSYALADVFTAEEIEAFPHSVSSIHWHDGPAYINADQKTLYVMIKSGDDLVTGLKTGRVAYCRTRGPSYLCRNTNDPHTWAPYNSVVPQH